MRLNHRISPLVSALNDSPPVILNEKIIPKVNSVKYLGVHLDKRLTWATHIKTKRKSLNIKLHKLRPLLSSNISLSNKLVITNLQTNYSPGYDLWYPTLGLSQKLQPQYFSSVSVN